MTIRSAVPLRINKQTAYQYQKGGDYGTSFPTLTEALKGVQPKSRRADVIRDIIRNNDYKKLSVAKEDEQKRILKKYDGMSAKTRSALKDLGFKITEEGKHYKSFLLR